MVWFVAILIFGSAVRGIEGDVFGRSSKVDADVFAAVRAVIIVLVVLLGAIASAWCWWFLDWNYYSCATHYCDRPDNSCCGSLSMCKDMMESNGCGDGPDI